MLLLKLIINKIVDVNTSNAEDLGSLHNPRNTAHRLLHQEQAPQRGDFLTRPESNRFVASIFAVVLVPGEEKDMMKTASSTNEQLAIYRLIPRFFFLSPLDRG